MVLAVLAFSVVSVGVVSWVFSPPAFRSIRSTLCVSVPVIVVLWRCAVRIKQILMYYLPLSAFSLLARLC